jgi:hypothetical protein
VPLDSSSLGLAEASAAGLRPQSLAALMADEGRTGTAGDIAAGFGISRATLYRELAKAKAAKTATVTVA